MEFRLNKGQLTDDGARLAGCPDTAAAGWVCVPGRGCAAGVGRPAVQFAPKRSSASGGDNRHI